MASTAQKINIIIIKTEVTWNYKCKPQTKEIFSFTTQYYIRNSMTKETPSTAHELPSLAE